MDVNTIHHRGRHARVPVSRRQSPSAVPPVSPLLLRAFAVYARSYIRRAFHAVRLWRAGIPLVLPDTPLVIYCNHPSWWDPLLCLFLARHLFPERVHYAPIEASALARYRFFARLGFFGVASGTMQGATTFLRVSQAILSQPQTALWLTPQGRFTDPRQRPVRLQSGIGYLARDLARGVFLPLALEYPFWEERFPEALVCFGEVVQVEPGIRRSAAEWNAFLASKLAAVQDKLADQACRRDRSAFEILLQGRAGVGGVYDLWRAWRAWLCREHFRQTHGDEDLC
jgi:1-acyl-sn-glycerol-3-phosphate acyltransferase